MSGRSTTQSSYSRLIGCKGPPSARAAADTTSLQPAHDGRLSRPSCTVPFAFPSGAVPLGARYVRRLRRRTLRAIAQGGGALGLARWRPQRGDRRQQAARATTPRPACTSAPGRSSRTRTTTARRTRCTHRRSTRARSSSSARATVPPAASAPPAERVKAKPSNTAITACLLPTALTIDLECLPKELPPSLSHLQDESPTKSPDELEKKTRTAAARSERCASRRADAPLRPRRRQCTPMHPSARNAAIATSPC